jgi:phosphatidylserine decarboxylase
MKLHKEGYPSIIIVFTFVLLINVVDQYFNQSYIVLHYFVWLLSIFLIVAILQFFRVPKRKTTKGENLIVAPADGKVVVIEEVMEDEYFHEKRLQISIFMSPTNVHINRYPISGIIKYFKYHPGLYLVAWHPKSSTENERTTVVVENEKGKSVLFRQIAGAMARRIVFYGKEGDVVEQGQECGFIKFGSRVDLLLPLDVDVKVELGQKVRGPETIIAEFKA